MRRTKVTKVESKPVIATGVGIEDMKQQFLMQKMANNCAQPTIEHYKHSINYFTKKLELNSFADINELKINLYIYTAKEDKTLGNINTFNSHLTHFRAFVYWLQDKGFVEGFNIKLLKVQEQPKVTYTDDELRRLVAEPQSDNWIEWRNWAVINYLVGTGNRASSITNIKIKDIDFDKNYINLTHTKNRSTQLVPLSASLVSVLNIYLNTFEWGEDDWLFSNRDGGQWSVTALGENIKKYNNKRGVSKQGTHLFRHTFAKNFLLGGGNVAQLQKLLGHKSPEMSLHYANIYSIEDLQMGYENLNPLNTLMKKRAI